MTLTIHRGTHEIGGSCVEICTDKAKILIDLGMPLDYDKHTTEEQTQIRSDAAEWCKGADAIFLSHAHADHYGFLDLLPQDTPIYATEETFAMLAEKYLYDPNSPVRNEEYYLHYAENLASFEGYSQVLRDRYARQASDCSINRIGTQAADFSFADSRGRVRSLHEIDAPYTLLFFSNPGCEACMGIIEMLKAEQKITDMVESGFLAVVNVYIDEDVQAWRDYMPIYPEKWYNGFDQDLVIRTEGLYCVRAIPSLYLLDKEKRVILKDAPENKMMNHLVNL